MNTSQVSISQFHQHSYSYTPTRLPSATTKSFLTSQLFLHISAPLLATQRFPLPPLAGHLKAIYVAPIKALVQEKAKGWKTRFGSTLGLVVQEVTGDTETDNFSQLDLDSTDIICTTPEKFDSMTRRHRDRGGMRFFNEVALVAIDEVHVLSENRGSALEAGVVARIQAVSRIPEMRDVGPLQAATAILNAN